MHTLTLRGKVVKKDFIEVKEIRYLIVITKFTSIDEARTKVDSETSLSIFVTAFQ